MIKDENYYVVHGWMRNRLNLKGNDLAIYALLYGFSQDGKSEFRGTVDYISEFTGASEKTVRRTLQHLTETGLTKKVTYNAEKGQTNGYICVSIECVGVGQNDHPPEVKMTDGVGQNDQRGRSKRPPIKNNNKEPYKESKKESKKVGRKVEKENNLSYDKIIVEAGIRGDTREALGRFIQYCSLNKHLLTNAELQRLIDNLLTYDEKERVDTLTEVIDNGRYMVKAKAELHYDEMGLASYSVGKTYQDILDTSFYSLTEPLKMKLWEFIRHRQAIGATLTNEALISIIGKLNNLYAPSDVAGKIKALDEAIRGGYRDIKDGEGWLKKAIEARKASGEPLSWEQEDEAIG